MKLSSAETTSQQQQQQQQQPTIPNIEPINTKSLLLLLSYSYHPYSTAVGVIFRFQLYDATTTPQLSPQLSSLLFSFLLRSWLKLSLLDVFGGGIKVKNAVSLLR